MQNSERALDKAGNSKGNGELVRAKPDTRADRTKDGSRAGDIQWTEFIKVCMRHRWRIHRDDAMHFCRLLKVVGSELA